MTQFRLLFGLFRTLRDRRELTGQLGLDRKALKIAGGIYFVMGALFALVVAIGSSAPVYAGESLALTTLFLVPILLSDAADAFMNPAEVFVLAPRPVRPDAYIAAKIATILSTAARVALPLNAFPAFAGLALRGTRWWYPLAHLLAVAICCVYTALATCGVFGALFQFVPVARLRSAALWSQIAIGVAIPVAPQLLRFFPNGLHPRGPYLSAVPIVWFARLALAGQPAAFHLAWGAALPVMGVSAILIAFGIRGVSHGYMERVVMMMRAKSRTTGTSRRGDWLGALVRVLTGAPSGRAAFGFFSQMAVRDWTFRRYFFQMTVYAFVVPALSMMRSGGLASPFARSEFVSAHLLPHVLGFALIGACQVMTNTSQHRAAWIFLTVPSDHRAFVRGIFWSLWLPTVAATHLIVGLVATWLWGWRDALAFVLFSAAVASTYVAASMMLIDGMPFSSPPQSSAPANALPTMIAFFAFAGVLAAFQNFVLFHRRVWVIGAALLFAGITAVLAPIACRIVERNVTLSVDQQGAGPQRMFQMSQPD